MELAVGTVIDRYVVDQVLGEGGMALVYLCKHTQLGTLHALKVLTISSRAIRERLVQEGQVQASLRHPNIVAVTDIVMINGAPGLVMEYIDGPSVDELLEERSLSYEQVDVLAEGILAGVAHAHAQGLVHRDLKPANIMLAIRGSVLVPKVTDFGLAKLLDADGKRGATRTGSTMGTPHYMSPEQVSDSKNVDGRTDVFALGAVLYEMVAGERAFSGDNLLQLFSAAANGEYTPIRQLKPDIPDRMAEAIEGALVPDRDHRIQSVADLLAIWKGEKVYTGGGQPVAPAGPFDADFLSSVKSISSIEGGSSAPSTPDPTWSPDGEVQVESLFSQPASEPAAKPRADAVSSSSIVSGKSLVVGGGAFLFVGGGVAVVLVVMVGALGLWWANQPEERDRGTSTSNPVQPIQPVDAAPAPPPTEPIAEVPVPADPRGRGPRAPDPVAPPQPVEPQPVEPVEPVPDANVAQPDTDSVVDTDAVAEVEPDPPAPTRVAELPSDPRERAEAVGVLRSDPTATARLIALTDDDPVERVRREAHESLAYQAIRRRGDLALLEAYFTKAMAEDRFSMLGKNLRAYGFVGKDVTIPERVMDQPGHGLVIQRKVVDAIGNIGERTGQKAQALAALQRVDPKIDSKIARGALEGAKERLAR